MKKQQIKSYDEDSMTDSDRFSGEKIKSGSSKCCKFMIVLLILGIGVGATIGYLIVS